MTKQEIICPRCRQLNVRSARELQRNDFATSQMEMEPRRGFNPKLCAMCFTHLESGRRSNWALPQAWLGWIMIYAAHALVVSFLCAPLIFMLGVSLTTMGVKDIYLPILVAALFTQVLGLWIAEKSRRRGELLHKKK